MLLLKLIGSRHGHHDTARAISLREVARLRYSKFDWTATTMQQASLLYS